MNKPTVFIHAHRLYVLGTVLPTAGLLVHVRNVAGPLVSSAFTQRKDETSSVIKMPSLVYCMAESKHCGLALHFSHTHEHSRYSQKAWT